MGLFDTLRRELIDVIEWLDDTHHTLAWRFPRFQNEIKNGAQLIVRPGQCAVFVHQGQVADVFGPGTHTLETKNLPVLSKLAAWKFDFNSPFKAEVYFVSTTQLTGLKWGTPKPVMLRDPDFGPVRLRAFGTYTLRTQDPRALIRELVGTDGIFNVDEVSELLRGLIANAVAEVLGRSEMSCVDLAANYAALSDKVRQQVIEQVDDEYGLDIPTLVVVNVSFPEEVEKALDTRSSMGVIGDMNAFQQYQFGRAMLAGAEGGSGDAMQMGMGLMMANQMGGSMLPAAPQGGGYGAPQYSSAQAASQPHPGGYGSYPPGPPPPPGIPPQLPPPAAWHVSLDGQQHGPLSQPQVITAVQQGQLTAQHLVWTPGMAGWAPAGQVPMLAPLFQGGGPPSAPPPLPTAPPPTGSDDDK